MSFLGIGPLELFFIVIIALIILGPRDMVKAGRSIGRLMRRTIFSPTWINVQNKVRNLPYELMREAGLEEEDLKIDPQQLDLGLDKAKSLQDTTARFAKDLEKSIDIPAEWTASSAPGSNSIEAAVGSPPPDGKAQESDPPAPSAAVETGGVELAEPGAPEPAPAADLPAQPDEVDKADVKAPADRPALTPDEAGQT